MSYLPSHPPSGRRLRTRLSVGAIPSRNGNENGRGDAEESSRSTERTCPRCKHRWLDGAAPREGKWPDLALSYVAPLLSVPEERMGSVQALVSSRGDMGSVKRVSQSLGIPRRTLSRRLASAGAPSPLAWVDLGRGMRAAEAMMMRATLKAVARDVGFPDQFQVSNYMDLHFGVWPTDVKKAPDPVWRWLADRWLDRVQEAMSA